MVAKTPAIRQEILDLEMPAMRAMLPQLHTKVMSRVCEQVQCSPKDRQTVAAAMAKALPSQGS